MMMDWLKRLHERIFCTHVDAESPVTDEPSQMEWLTRLEDADSPVTGEPSQMEWLTRLNEPFFRSEKDVETYVTRELAGAVPEGWVVRRFRDRHLAWTIEKKKLEPGEWPTQEYGVRISNGMDVVILTYGNNDAGPLGLHHALHIALVIDSVMLRKFNLGKYLSYLFASHKPNEWGYT